MFKSGYVSIVGKPNAGKSSLINKLVGFKIAITTPKPQTTRFNIRGVVTSEKSQIVFIDTPGVNLPKNSLEKQMMEGVTTAVNYADVIIYLVDAVKPKIDEVQTKIMEDISKRNSKVILAINKIDKIEKEKILKIITMYNEEAKKLNLEFVEIVPISVYKDDGLDVLIELVEKYLKEGEKIYDEDEFTDMTEREIVEENIREKLLNNLSEEVPHGVNVMVESFKERVNKNGAEVYDIEAVIMCLKESHRPIIIGKNGSMLKHICNQSRIDLEKILGVKINLKIWVKVRQKWTDNEVYFRNIKK